MTLSVEMQNPWNPWRDEPIPSTTNAIKPNDGAVSNAPEVPAEVPLQPIQTNNYSYGVPLFNAGGNVYETSALNIQVPQVNPVWMQPNAAHQLNYLPAPTVAPVNAYVARTNATNMFGRAPQVGRNNALQSIHQLYNATQRNTFRYGSRSIQQERVPSYSQAYHGGYVTPAQLVVQRNSALATQPFVVVDQPVSNFNFKFEAPDNSSEALDAINETIPKEFGPDSLTRDQLEALGPTGPKEVVKRVPLLSADERTPSGTAGYRCPFVGCSRICKDRSLLKDHLCIIAHKNPSFKCDGCELVYTRGSGLVAHARLKAEKDPDSTCVTLNDVNRKRKRGSKDLSQDSGKAVKVMKTA